MTRVNLIKALASLLPRKQSRGWYAKYLGVTENEIEDVIKEARAYRTKEEETEYNIDGYRFNAEHDFKNGKQELTGIIGKEIKTEEDLVEACKIDLKVWKIDRMICNAWGKPENQSWQVKAWLSKIEVKEDFQNKFIDFLKDYDPEVAYDDIVQIEVPQNKACIIINKQDAHLNKFDVNGNNDITTRFMEIEVKVDFMLQKASLTNDLQKVIYVVGSDEFNSEWTGLTTKGTPQQNILTHDEAYKAICGHEIRVINNLMERVGEVKILYIPGNHDEYVGWHLIQWLQAYYRNEPRIQFDASTEYTKYERYNNVAMMFNHGDDLKAKDLAHRFPVEFKKEWSLCDNFYIFIGDKHNKLVEDVHGMRCFRISSLSTAKSKWDKKKHHIDPAEMTGFVISEKSGMTDTYTEIISY